MNYGAVSDNLRDTLVTNLADDGIRLTVEAKYKEYSQKVVGTIIPNGCKN